MVHHEPCLNELLFNMCVHGRAQLLLLLLVSHNVKEQRPLCSLLTFFHLSRAFFFVSADIEINMKEVAKKKLVDDDDAATRCLSHTQLTKQLTVKKVPSRVMSAR